MAIEQEEHVITEDIITIERDSLSVETLGLTLKKSKNIISNIQNNILQQQTKEYLRFIKRGTRNSFL